MVYRLHAQSVPPLLPAYNSYMGGVDTTGHLEKTYGYDRKSKRYWLRLFFHFVDIASNNAYIIYKHNSAKVKNSGEHFRVKTLKQFRLAVVEGLICVPTRNTVKVETWVIPPLVPSLGLKWVR